MTREKSALTPRGEGEKISLLNPAPARRSRDAGATQETCMQVSIRPLRRGLMVLALALPALASAQAPITLHGAVQFNDDHAFNKSLLKFEELVKKYYGKPVNFVLHRNSELGLEKDYFAYMNQGNAVDYAIVSPAHMSTFAKAAPFIDTPFLFRDLDHWNKVLDADAVQADRRRGRARRPT